VYGVSVVVEQAHGGLVGWAVVVPLLVYPVRL